MQKLITDAAQAALDAPSPENLETIKAFWTAVLDAAEQDAPTMQWHRSWVELARRQVAETRWDEEVCTVYSWRRLKESTERFVNRFYIVAAEVVKQLEGEAKDA